MKCACIFEERDVLDSRPPRVIEECGYHACLRRDGDYLDHRVYHEWHVAINRFSDFGRKRERDFPHFMYEAKRAASEVPRLIRLHREEREGKLPKVHQQCSRSPVEQISDNYLECCLGVKCKECPHLQALEKAELLPEQIDIAKAWTCVGHILETRGRNFVDTSEGYLLTVGDRMFWQRVYESLASDSPGDGETGR